MSKGVKVILAIAAIIFCLLAMGILFSEPLDLPFNFSYLLVAAMVGFIASIVWLIAILKSDKYSYKSRKD